MFEMKKILLLIFYILDVTFTSSEYSNVRFDATENVTELTCNEFCKKKMTSYTPTVQMQKPNNMISPPGVKQNGKLQRTFYPMGLINSNCLKSLHRQSRNKNRSGYRRPFEIVKPLRMSAFRNNGNNHQTPSFYKMRQNLLQERQNNKRPFGNGRIIFIPPYVKSSVKGVNVFQNASKLKINKITQSNSQEGLFIQTPKKNTNEARKEISVEEKLKQKEENTENVKSFPSDEEAPETRNPHTIENLTVFDDMHDLSKTIKPNSYKTSEIPKKSNEIKSTTETYLGIFPQHFWYQKPNPTQTYEVEEIIEEELSVNLDNQKANNFKNFPFTRPALLEKETKTVTSSDNGQKMNGIQDMMGSSINTVLKTLMSPMLNIFPKAENNRKTFPKEKLQNRPISYNYFTSTSPPFITFSGQRPQNFHKIINSSRPLPNKHHQPKHLKLTTNSQVDEIFQTWTQETTESTVEPKKKAFELTSNSRVNIMPFLKVEYNKNVPTTGKTEISYTPLGALKTEKNPLQKTTTVTEIENTSLPSLEPKFRGQTSVTLLETQKILESFTTQKTLSAKTENLTTALSQTQTTLKKILSSQEFTTSKFTQSIDLLVGFTEDSTSRAKTSPEVQKVAINKADSTVPDIQDFTYQPTTFDLTTTFKSDSRRNQDTMGKNGRKMHFLYEPTTSKLITDLGSTGPRRSDILITENFNDYVDIDNSLSTLNYLEKLKQNNSFSPRNSLLNSSFDESLIPLISIVINDLRKGGISPEDVSVLSRAFGKYWSSIVILANITNLDMLPLLKMNSEEDWNNIRQSFLPETTENTEFTTVKMTETYLKQASDDYSSYDYLAEYKDFYEYVFNSEKEEKEKKRKKARLKRNNKNNLKRTEAYREYFESRKEDEEDSTTDNMYEDLFLIETLQDINARGLNGN